MYSLLFLNLDLFILTQTPEYVENVIISIFSELILFSPLYLFIKSLFISEQDIIELECPSRYKSRKGTIKIGKIMEKKKKKHKFFLSLKDLGRHMFVCGTTGSGKSNSLQYFLMNFKKCYDLPFLLVEFKGE